MLSIPFTVNVTAPDVQPPRTIAIASGHALDLSAIHAAETSVSNLLGPDHWLTHAAGNNHELFKHGPFGNIRCHRVAIVTAVAVDTRTDLSFDDLAERIVSGLTKSHLLRADGDAIFIQPSLPELPELFGENYIQFSREQKDRIGALVQAIPDDLYDPSPSLLRRADFWRETCGFRPLPSTDASIWSPAVLPSAVLVSTVGAINSSSSNSSLVIHHAGSLLKQSSFTAH